MGVPVLWDLLAPIGRRVFVETLAGKHIAIDASIWMKTLIASKKAEKKDPHLLKEKTGKQWKLWRSSSEYSSSQNVAFSAVVSTVIRCPLKNFRLVREEWAAIRIQTSFRRFLVRWKGYGPNDDSWEPIEGV